MLCKLKAIAAGLALSGLVACGDDSGPGGSLDTEEQAALVVALTQAGAFQASIISPLALTSQLSQEAELGSLGTYTAIGGQALLTADYPGTENDETLVITSVTGWSNLNTGARTVDNAVWASALSFTSSFPNQLDGLVMIEEDAFGGYWERSTSSRYFAESGEGQFTLSGTSFGDPQDCDNIPSLGEGITVSECSIAIGTMQGDFDFVAARISGSGVDPFTQPNIAYDVPAARLTMTLTFEEAPAAVRAK